MYAVRRTSVKQWGNEPPAQRYAVTVTRGGIPDTSIKPERISVIDEEVMYWRRADHIHKWFVDNVQNGKDDCGTYFVSDDELRELLALCKQVLEDAEMIDGDIEVATAYTFWHPNGKAVREACKVLKDTATAAELLPRYTGSFFGSYEYGEDYIKAVQDTHDWIIRTFESEGGTSNGIFYESFW